MSEWVSEWVGEWVTEWVGEWVNEWVSEWGSEWVGFRRWTLSTESVCQNEYKCLGLMVHLNKQTQFIPLRKHYIPTSSKFGNKQCLFWEYQVRYLSSGNRAAPEKATFHQMVNKYVAIFGNRKFNCVFTRPRHWSLSQASLIQSTLSLHASLRPVPVPNRITYIPPDNLPQVCTSGHHQVVILVFWPPPKLPSFSTPCWLSATANSIYSQLLSTTGSRLLHPRPDVTPSRGNKEPN